jgi:hypothetical protein
LVKAQPDHEAVTMDNATQARIHQIVADTLRELGIPDAKFSVVNTTILIRDGYCVGHSLVCGHIRVVLLAGGEKIEFHDSSGGLLRQICVEEPPYQGNAAA